MLIKSEIKFSSNLPTPARWKNDAVNQQIKEFKMNNIRKTTEVNKDLWVHDYGDGTFEVCLRASGPTGAYVYRYEKGRLKYSQRRSYGGVSSPKYYNFFK